MTATSRTEPLFRRAVTVADHYRLFVERAVADDGTEAITGMAIIDQLGAADPGRMDPAEVERAVADVAAALRCKLKLVSVLVNVVDGKAVWSFMRIDRELPNVCKTKEQCDEA